MTWPPPAALSVQPQAGPRGLGGRRDGAQTSAPHSRRGVGSKAGPGRCGGEGAGKLEGPRDRVRRLPGARRGRGGRSRAWGPAECGEAGRAALPEGNGPEGVGAWPGFAGTVAGGGGWVRLQAWGAAGEKPRKWGMVGVGGVSSEWGLGAAGGSEIPEVLAGVT